MTFNMGRMAEGREKSLMVNNIVVAEAMLLLVLLFLMPLPAMGNSAWQRRRSRPWLNEGRGTASRSRYIDRLPRGSTGKVSRQQTLVYRHIFARLSRLICFAPRGAWIRLQITYESTSGLPRSRGEVQIVDCH
jgi:hypothetical protein